MGKIGFSNGSDNIRQDRKYEPNADHVEKHDDNNKCNGKPTIHRNKLPFE